MAILYTKETLYRPDDTPELTFDVFFNLIDELIQSETLHYSPRNIRNHLALYSKGDRESIEFFTIHTTSENDNKNIGGFISNFLSKESDYKYHVTVTQASITGIGKEEGKIYPAIQLYGLDNSSDIRQKRTEMRVYKIEFEKPQGRIIGLSRQHIF